jgi:hypothetical protein
LWLLQSIPSKNSKGVLYLQSFVLDLRHFHKLKNDLGCKEILKPLLKL